MGAPPVPAEPTGLAEDPDATLNFQGGGLPPLTETLPTELKPVMAVLEVGAVLGTTTVGRQRGRTRIVVGIPTCFLGR